MSTPVSDPPPVPSDERPSEVTYRQVQHFRVYLMLIAAFLGACIFGFSITLEIYEKDILQQLYPGKMLPPVTFLVLNGQYFLVALSVILPVVAFGLAIAPMRQSRAMYGLLACVAVLVLISAALVLAVLAPFYAVIPTVR